MQPIRQLMNTISELASPQACLFTPADLRSILPNHSDAAFKTLLSRAVGKGNLGQRRQVEKRLFNVEINMSSDPRAYQTYESQNAT